MAFPRSKEQGQNIYWPIWQTASNKAYTVHYVSWYPKAQTQEYNHAELEPNMVLAKSVKIRKFRQVNFNGYALLGTKRCNERKGKLYIFSFLHFWGRLEYIIKIFRSELLAFCGSWLLFRYCAGPEAIRHPNVWGHVHRTLFRTARLIFQTNCPKIMDVFQSRCRSLPKISNSKDYSLKN